MKVIIAGSRGVTDYDYVCMAIKESGLDITEVVSGTARGVDRLGEQWAKDNDIPVKKFPADWSMGKGAGYIRNTDMAKYADGLIAISLNNSKGTGHMIDIANKQGLEVFVKKVSKWIKL